MHNQTLEGHWWLPGKKNERVAGVLTYDGNHVHLRLLGAFTRQVERRPGVIAHERIQKFPLLLGSCEGKSITVLRCRETGHRAVGSQLIKQTFSVNFILTNIWLNAADEKYFDQIELGIDNLLLWSTLSGLNLQIDTRADDEDIYAVTWQHQESLVAQVDGAQVELGLGLKRNSKNRADRRETALREAVTITVTLDAQESVETLVSDWTRPFQDLLTLAMGEPCGFTHVTLTRRAVGDGAKTGRPDDADLYYPPVYVSEPDSKPAATPIFTLNDVTFAHLIPAWFSTFKRLEPVVGMAISQQYVDRIFVESRLITAVAAAEGLHRRLSQETYMPDDEFSEIMKNLKM